jgi:hypothetical protein
MKWVEHEVADWIYRLLGLCYIEEKLGKTVKDKDGFKKDIKELKKIAIESLREHYKSVKDDKSFQEYPLFDVLQKAFEDVEDTEEIRKAKEILGKHGFKVTRK